jgi:hypothetical protein
MPAHPRWWRILLLGAAALVIATAFAWQSRPAASNAQPDMRIGFSIRSLVEERRAESTFAAQLSTESISRFHRDITRRPHMAGSPASMEVAERIRQGGALVLARTYNPSTGGFGNLYSNLLEYVVSADLLFYILTIAAVFRLRRLWPDAERPCRAWGYPVVPAFYIVCAAVILVVLFLYRPSTTIPGLVIVLIGVPLYFAFRRSAQLTTS